MDAIYFFAGTGSFSEVAKEHWFRVYSLDYEPKHKCEITMDILDFCPGDFPHIFPRIIWASPDCTSFSFASCGFHRDRFGNPKTKKAFLWDELLQKTLSLFEEYWKINPDLEWYMENPRGHMAKRPYLIEWMRANW